MPSSSRYKGQWFLVSAVLLLFTIFSIVYATLSMPRSLPDIWDDPYFYYAISLKELEGKGRYAQLLAEKIGNETGFHVSFSPYRFTSPSITVP